MRKLLVASLSALLGLALLGSTSPAKAIAVRIVPLPERIATADCVITGKVEALEKKNVMLRASPAARDKIEYQVAIIKIDEALVGAKGLTHIKVVFQPTGGGPVVPGGPIRPRPGFGGVNFTVGQEGCFFLNQHFEGSYYQAPPFTQQLDKKAAGYAKQLETVKRFAKLVSDPKAGLASKDADERALTAGLLIFRYRTYRGSPNQEPIDAKESKQILLALADGNWAKPFNETDINPQMAFQRLGLGPQDGFKPGPFKNFQKEYPEAAKKWIKENADKYVIKQYVAEKKDK